MALVVAVYVRSLNFQFVLDDHRFTADPRIQEAGHIWDYFANYVWAQFTGGPSSFYRPVFVLWVRLNFVLAGLSSWGWHLLSIAKHVAVAALLALLIWKLLRDWSAALAAAALFALHPAQTESVSWVTVPDPLMAAGILGALLFYLKYVRFGAPHAQEKKSRKKSEEASNRSPIWMIASAGTYFAALLAKETAIVFPAVIFAFALCVAPSQSIVKSGSKSGSATLRSRVVQALLHSLPFVGVTVAYLLLRLNALGALLGSATQHLPWRTVILSWPVTLWFYLKVMFWPVKSYAFADPTLVDKFSLRSVLVPLAALACCGAILAIAILWMWRKAQALGNPRGAGIQGAVVAGTLLLILPLLPALNLNALNPGDFLHGRYTYLSLAGLALLVASGWIVLKNARLTLLCAAGTATIAFAALTFSQQSQWRDDATIFTTAHQLAPHNDPVSRNLANTVVQQALQLDEEGRCSEAVPVFEQITRDYPEDWYAWAGLGDCFVQLKNLPRAEESLHRAADLSRNSRVLQQWQELRVEMGLPNPPPAR
ncbi:MAG TPA: tetratricopeptide repeat protein [Candidatus Sulfotelmatobacter sp.]|nr:tetratricopeptide repeat protein [Candidatus Sulfotelmatobacter sp.]